MAEPHHRADPGRRALLAALGGGAVVGSGPTVGAGRAVAAGAVGAALGGLAALWPVAAGAQAGPVDAPDAADAPDADAWFAEAQARAGSAAELDAARDIARLRTGRQLFGSPCELLLRHPAGRVPVAALVDTWAGLAQIHGDWNAWKPGELGRVNRALARGEPVRPQPALAAVIRQAAVLERASAGLFNAAIGRWVGAWGFHADVLSDGAAPHPDRLARWAAAPPSLARLEWRGDRLRSHHPGLQIDLGAIAKGVAIDAALDRLARHGVADALVDLGGNLAAMGQGGAADRAGGPAGWAIGIRDPFDAGWVARLHTRGREAVVTSGSYERTRRVDGVTRHHILDPSTAAPAPGLVSVTVLHRSAALADVAATALLVAGPARWQQVAERLGVREVLVIDRHGRAQVSAPLAPRLDWASAAWRGRVDAV